MNAHSEQLWDPRWYLRPENYEAEEWSRPDEMAMFQCLWRVGRRLLNRLADASVADLCCGTGIPLLGLASHPHIRALCGVDVDPEAIAFARQRFARYERLSFQVRDALDFLTGPETFDLIVLSSAYHHLPHDRKLAFLRAVRSRLSPRGRALLGENVLGPCDIEDRDGYDRAVDAYYKAVGLAAQQEAAGLPPIIEALIHQNVQLSRQRIVEFKVDYRRLLNDIGASGLRVEESHQVWPSLAQQLPAAMGNYVLVMRA